MRLIKKIVDEILAAPAGNAKDVPRPGWVLFIEDYWLIILIAGIAIYGLATWSVKKFKDSQDAETIKDSP